MASPESGNRMTNDSDSIATLRLLAKCGSMDLSMLGPIADEIAQLHAAVKTAQELAARRLMEIERLKAEVNGLPKARKCMASATSDPPQDCDAPFCGCDPAWSACIEMLQECNLLVSRPAHEPSEQLPSQDSRLERIQQERLTWAMACECTCDACEKLSSVIRLACQGASRDASSEKSETVKDSCGPGCAMGANRPAQTSDEIRDLACCDKFVRESASEFCATCGYTNLDHLRKRSSLRTSE